MVSHHSARGIFYAAQNTDFYTALHKMSQPIPKLFLKVEKTQLISFSTSILSLIFLILKFLNFLILCHCHCDLTLIYNVCLKENHLFHLFTYASIFNIKLVALCVVLFCVIRKKTNYCYLFCLSIFPLD